MVLILDDLDTMENEALEEAMVYFVIEVSLNEYEDNIIETDPSVEPVRSRPISEVDKKQVDVVLFEVVDQDNIRHFEAIYGPPASNTVVDIQAGMEIRKMLQATKEPIRLMTLFAKLDHRLTRKDQ